MLDIPKLGLDLLNRIEARFAESAETEEEFEVGTACLEGLRGLVDPRSEVKQALSATAENGTDYVKREKDVMRSLMETTLVRRML
jgi:hypothetical protein